MRYDATVPDNPTSVDPGCTAGDGIWQPTCGKPNFTWSGATDGGSGVAGYHVYWGTIISGTTPAVWTTVAGFDLPAVESGVPYCLRVQTEDQVGNQAAWVTLFTLMYDNQPPLISDLTPANGSVVDTPWPTTSAALSDPQPGSGARPEHCRRVEPLSTTLTVDGEAVTPQVNTADGFEYTPEQRLAEGSHSVPAQVYDRAGNQTETGPWTFSVDTDSAASLGVTKYYYFGSQRVAMRQEDVVYYLHGDHLGSTSLTTDQICSDEREAKPESGVLIGVISEQFFGLSNGEQAIISTNEGEWRFVGP